MDPKVWASESRQAALRFVYTPDVLQAALAVERGLVDRVEALTLSEDYLRDAGRVAQLRAAQAGQRLATILRDGVRDR